MGCGQRGGTSLRSVAVGSGADCPWPGDSVTELGALQVSDSPAGQLGRGSTVQGAAYLRERPVRAEVAPAGRAARLRDRTSKGGGEPQGDAQTPSSLPLSWPRLKVCRAGHGQEGPGQGTSNSLPWTGPRGWEVRAGSGATARCMGPGLGGRATGLRQPGLGREAGWHHVAPTASPTEEKGGGRGKKPTCLPPRDAWLLSTTKTVTVRSLTRESGLGRVCQWGRWGWPGRRLGAGRGLGTAGTGPAFLQPRGQ